jgi:D-cysteine desulfhydrase
MNLDLIPRISLSQFPTPLDEAPRLAKELGLKSLFIKRDDCTNLGLGGNKVRKLEYLMADALAKQADVVITLGGIQSNHARLTAAAARKVGMPECILVLSGAWDGKWQGNMLLDIVFGATVRVLPDAGVKQTEAEADRIASQLQQEGRRPYLIPMGGSTPIGALGYVSAIRELASQMGKDANPLIITAVGSGGTIAGCVLGAKLFMPNAQVLGISVAGMSGFFKKHSAEVATGTARLLEEEITFTADDIDVSDQYFGTKYAVPSEAGNAAILLAGRTEGLVLDPVYTGKAMSGLIDLAKTGQIDINRPVVFLHTGGSPALMAYEEEFRGYRKEL